MTGVVVLVKLLLVVMVVTVGIGIGDPGLWLLVAVMVVRMVDMDILHIFALSFSLFILYLDFLTYRVLLVIVITGSVSLLTGLCCLHIRASLQLSVVLLLDIHAFGLLYRFR